MMRIVVLFLVLSLVACEQKQDTLPAVKTQADLTIPTVAKNAELEVLPEGYKAVTDVISGLTFPVPVSEVPLSDSPFQLDGTIVAISDSPYAVTLKVHQKDLTKKIFRVMLKPTTKYLRSGEPSLLSSFNPGDRVYVRGYRANGKLMAVLMDTEKRRAPSNGAYREQQAKRAEIEAAVNKKIAEQKARQAAQQAKQP